MTPLEDLLQQCTVKITVPGGWGTGFFVAPGLILTCAHVVRQAADFQVTVVYPARQQSLSAIVKAKADDGKTLDLALVELSEPLSDHPCVLLDAEPVAIGQALYSYGYLESYTNAAPVRPVNEGETGDTPPLLKLQGAQIEKGISGAALLNLKTGKVCGMVKETRAAGFDLGGGAIPTRVILAQFPELRELQRAFHGSDRRWANLITQPGVDFQPYLRSLIANEKYQQKWGFYTPTDAVSKIQQPRAASELDIGLMVQLMQPKTAEGDGTPTQEEKTERLPVLEGIRKYAADHVLLMGRPGSGKSTALLSLLVEAAQEALADPSASIPVLVELRYLDADRPSVLERIGAFLQSHALSVEEATLKALLVEGKLLLLIDGVNELPSESARRAVARFRQDYAKTSMIFTTRDMAIGGDVGIEKKLEMQPLNESQMRQFVQAYLPEQGEPMLRQLQGRLREVGQTPLLLWMLCQVFQGLQQIPTSLGLLFRWFAGEYDKLKRDVPVSEGLRHWQTDLLQQLAFNMMQAEEPTELRVAISRPEAETLLTAFLQGKVDYPAQRAKEWLEDLLEHHLIQPIAQIQLEFHHQLLQEYYAAEYLLKLLPTLTDEQLKRDYLNYLKWTEPVALMLAMLEKEAQALRVVKLAMDDVDLMLGARLAGEVKPIWQATTIGWIDAKLLPISLKVQCWETSHSEKAVEGLLTALQSSDYHMRERAAMALGTIGSDQAVEDLLHTLQDSHDSVHRSVADALRAIGSDQAVTGLLTALQDSDKFVRGKAFWRVRERTAGRVRERAAGALGKIGSDQTVAGLLRALQHSNYDVRRRAAEALGKIGSEQTVAGLLDALRDSDNSVRRNAAEALKAIGSEQALVGLLNTLQDSDKFVRETTAEALGKIGSEQAVAGLLDALRDSDNSVRRKAAEALGKIGSEQALVGLLNTLQDSNDSVRRSVAEALGAIGSEKAVVGLLTAIQDSDYHVRESAAEALRAIDNKQAIAELLTALQDSDNSVRWNAAMALGAIGSEQAVEGLLTALQDSDNSVRWNAAMALGTIGSEQAITGLLTALQDSDYHMRWRAADALGKIGSEQAITGLLTALQDSDTAVRWSTADALGNIGGEQAVVGLLTALQDSDDFVRESTAETLGNIGGERAAAGLLTALQDSDNSVRRKAADALGKIGSEQAVAGLLIVLQDSDTAVRERAAEALGNIGSKQAVAGLLTALQDSDTAVRERVAEALGNIGGEQAVVGLLAALQDSDGFVRFCEAKAVGKIGNPLPLADLWQLCHQHGKDYFWNTISAIQNRCKFYNYKIFQAHLAAQQADRPASPNSDPNAITIQTLESLTIMTDKAPIFNQQHATIGVNYAAEGSTIEFTQHTSASEQTFELLLTDYQQFIEQLQQKYPTLADPTTVPQIIEVEAKLIEAQDHHRWQNFLNLKRLWHGSKQAGIKIGEHFAENNVWAKGAIAFLEGVSEGGK